jgi:hypothetical protein
MKEGFSIDSGAYRPWLDLPFSFLRTWMPPVHAGVTDAMS